MSDALTVLQAGAAELGLPLAPAQFEQLLAYLALIQKWNQVYNLTAVRDPREMLTHHLLDSLTAVAPLLRHTQGRPAKVLDVGSGGGLPGVVLAICRPELDVSCVDTVGKKAAFIQQVAAALKLPNLHGIHDRVERLSGPFDVICCRAFAALPDLVSWSRGALPEAGVWMAMKGKHPLAEIEGLPADVDAFHVEPLTVPGLQAERCMVWMRPTRQS
ncbi:MAG: 16S rRNA (guanine(527)-N(7))-methyltransferase RsmG [Limnohabitans sp.]